jgi:hypothetical protein
MPGNARMMPFPHTSPHTHDTSATVDPGIEGDEQQKAEDGDAKP